LKSFFDIFFTLYSSRAVLVCFCCFYFAFWA